MTEQREALAEALWRQFGYPSEVEWEELDAEARDEWREEADALLASDWMKRRDAEVRAEMAGVLAGDETLVEAGARAFYEGFDSNPHHRRQWPAPEQHIPWWMARARDVISAVAAALAEEGGDRG